MVLLSGWGSVSDFCGKLLRKSSSRCPSCNIRSNPSLAATALTPFAERLPSSCLICFYATAAEVREKDCYTIGCC